MYLNIIMNAQNGFLNASFHHAIFSKTKYYPIDKKDLFYVKLHNIFMQKNNYGDKPYLSFG